MEELDALSAIIAVAVVAAVAIPHVPLRMKIPLLDYLPPASDSSSNSSSVMAAAMVFAAILIEGDEPLPLVAVVKTTAPAVGKVRPLAAIRLSANSGRVDTRPKTKRRRQCPPPLQTLVETRTQGTLEPEKPVYKFSTFRMHLCI